MTTSPSNSSERSAVKFVEQQLESAQRSLVLTRTVTVALALAVLAYGAGMTTWLHYNVLQPEAAADIATTHVVNFVQTSGAALSDQVVREVPVTVASLPDMLIDQLPRYRTQLEDRFEVALRDYGHEFQPDVEEYLDQFVNENHDRIHTILGAAADPALTKHFGDQFEAELLAYLTTPNDNGESVVDMLDHGRTVVEDVQTRLHRLAHATDLSSEELKLRRLVAATLQATDARL